MCCPCRMLKDLTPYRAVVAGSAMQGAKWLPEALQFVQTHQSALASKPFAALFGVYDPGYAGW